MQKARTKYEQVKIDGLIQGCAEVMPAEWRWLAAVSRRSVAELPDESYQQLRSVVPCLREAARRCGESKTLAALYRVQRALDARMLTELGDVRAIIDDRRSCVTSARWVVDHAEVAAIAYEAARARGMAWDDVLAHGWPDASELRRAVR
jgi:hypothetical protein